jgi:hypothetical protein
MKLQPPVLNRDTWRSQRHDQRRRARAIHGTHKLTLEVGEERIVRAQRPSWRAAENSWRCVRIAGSLNSIRALPSSTDRQTSIPSSARNADQARRRTETGPLISFFASFPARLRAVIRATVASRAASRSPLFRPRPSCPLASPVLPGWFQGSGCRRKCPSLLSFLR